MNFLKHIFLGNKNLRLIMVAFVALFFAPASAFAGDIIDSFNLAPFVPMVLDAMMAIATGGYEFFVGNGDGFIYILVWGFLAISLSLYAVKLFLPSMWVSFFGFSGGGEMQSGKATGMTIATNMLKPALRAIIAATVLLQIKPVYLTEWLVNPFLEFGAIYTNAITETLNDDFTDAPEIKCPENIIAKAWISENSCNFLIRPVSEISHANNRIIKRGFDFLTRGLRGLITLVPHGGSSFMDIITGILLITTFVGSNLFMALLIIQGIFNFGMALVLYPFQVLTYVVKSNDKWLDIWPAFSGIIKALQQLVITMIACAFILAINIAIIKSLFQWTGSAFIVPANGAASTNLPQMTAGAYKFGLHSMLWLSSIMTFYLMFRIFELTREQLQRYVGNGMDKLYNSVKSDSKNLGKGISDWGKKVGKAVGWIKSK